MTYGRSDELPAYGLWRQISAPTSRRGPAPAQDRQQTPPARGWFVVDPVAPVELGPFPTDVIVFARGPGFLSAPGGRYDLVDPATAVRCRAGWTCHWVACRGLRARFDWFAVRLLAEELPEALELSQVEDARPAVVAVSPAWVHLALRCLAEGRPAPRRRWLAPAPALDAADGSEGPPSADPEDDITGGAFLARKARQHLAFSFPQNLAIADVAEELGVSESHLSRTFKRWVGLTILEYRHELRMRTALELIGPAVEDLAPIAFDLGYASHSHFSTRFLRTFGLTPSAYRAHLARPAGEREAGRPQPPEPRSSRYSQARASAQSR